MKSFVMLFQSILVIAQVTSYCSGLSIQNNHNNKHHHSARPFTMQQSHHSFPSLQVGVASTRCTHMHGRVAIRTPQRHHMVSVFPALDVSTTIDMNESPVAEQVSELGNTSEVQVSAVQPPFMPMNTDSQTLRQRMLLFRTARTTAAAPEVAKDNKKDKTVLTFRRRLAKMGFSVVLAYGVVSNLFTSVCTSLSWYISSTKYHVSPLAPGQWKSFVAIYAGIYVVASALRPLRVALAIGLSRYVDAMIQTIQTRFQVSRNVAIGMTIFFVNIVGSSCLMTAGIAVASLASGVPIW
jgi:hypothetical protein